MMSRHARVAAIVNAPCHLDPAPLSTLRTLCTPSVQRYSDAYPREAATSSARYLQRSLSTSAYAVWRVEMRRTRHLGAVVIAGLATILGSLLTAQGKPVVKTNIETYSPGHIRTFEELLTRSTVVVDADVVGQRTQDIVTAAPPPGRQGPEPPPRIGTTFTLTVRSVHKALPGLTLVAGQTITVDRAGGTMDRGTFIDEQLDPLYPLFKVGERYILFLVKWRPSSDELSVTTADGAFRIASGKIVPVGLAPFATQWSNKTTAELLAEVARVGAGR
jgi:hypothetical protein